MIVEVLPKNLKFPIQPSELSFPDYDCFNNCFNDNVHLGTAIFVNKQLKAQQVQLTSSQASARENVWAEIKLENNETLLVGCIYRPPSNTSDDNKLLYDTILSLIDKRTHVLVAGDFNQPTIDWKNESASAGVGNQAYIFMDFVRDSYLIQHVCQPTHYRGTQHPTLIDLIFSNEEEMVQNIRHCAPLGKSHHQCLFFDFLCSGQENSKCYEGKYDFKKADFEKMRKLCEENDLVLQLEEKNVEESWDCISSCIHSVVEECVPKFYSGKKEGRNKPKYWNEKVAEKTKEKDLKYQKWLSTQDDEDWKAYTRSRNQAKNECRKADKEYQKNIARQAKSNPKLFFSYANSKLKVREGIPDLENVNGEKIVSNKEKAELLNNFFCSVFTCEQTESVPTCDDKNFETPLDDVVFTKEAVLKKLKNINPSKSNGPDNINACVLNELAEQLCEPIAILFQRSMNEGTLPKSWKDANVTPLFKKGQKSKPNNYRPVSLTCILCKIMEAIIRDVVVNFLEKNDFLSSVQHGFISMRSCTTNLLATLDSWTEMLDSGAPVDAIYLDFSKAFDSVPHQRLLEKLRSYGIHSNLLKWIADFLIGRRQRVSVNGEFSEWSNVTSGVPQGSVLGPVLFVIYINDLPDIVESLCQLYADDTKMFSQVDTIERYKQIQSDLDNLVNWADKWQLRFNSDKCHVLHFGHNNPIRPYYMRKHDSTDYVELATSEEEKDLGIVVDNQLTFAKHVETQVKKANRLVGLIRRSFTYLDSESMKHLFVTIVRPHLEFGNVAWSPRFNKEIDLIEKVQARATKVIPGMKGLSYEQRLRVMKLPSLQYRRKRGDLIEVYKYVNGHYNVNSNLLCKDTSRRTRGHAHKLTKRSCNLNVRQNFFSFRVVNTWNNMPSYVVEAPSLNSFKARLDKHFENELYKS